MSLVMRGTYSHRLELQQQLETALGACIDYHNALIRASVPDPVTGQPEIKKLYARFELKVEPRSLYGERPRKER